MPPACETLLAPLNTVLATRTHASCSKMKIWRHHGST
jgi:hypothetical protein